MSTIMIFNYPFFSLSAVLFFVGFHTYKSFFFLCEIVEVVRHDLMTIRGININLRFQTVIKYYFNRRTKSDHTIFNFPEAYLPDFDH